MKRKRSTEASDNSCEELEEADNNVKKIVGPSEKVKKLHKKKKYAQSDFSARYNNDIPIKGSNEESDDLSDKNDGKACKLFGVEEKKQNVYRLDLAHTDILHLIIDEIGLEGLDGITIETLWKRISCATRSEVLITDGFKEFVWNVITSLGDISLYCLEKPRGELVIYEKAVVDSVQDVVDIYPFQGINKDDIIGSCAEFDSREDVTCIVRSKTLQEAEKEYGSKLVIVASQSIRSSCIMNKLMDPTIELSLNQYCMLERIGRSRYDGETTHGKMSLQVIDKDSKHLFYNRKILSSHFLVTKQPFQIQTTSAQVNGILLHLPRFYNMQKTKAQIMTEQIVEVLRSAPHHRMEHSAIQKIFGNTEALNKLCKMHDFKKFVKYGMIKYRDMYPNADEKEWKVKTKCGEKMLRTLHLIDPMVNVSGAWNEEEPKEKPKEESSDGEVENEFCPNVPIVHQVRKFIQSDESGKSIKEITSKIGVDFYTVRSAIKQLVDSNVVVGVKIDLGRSRYIKYKDNTACSTIKNEGESESNVETEQNSQPTEYDLSLASILNIDVRHLLTKSNVIIQSPHYKEDVIESNAPPSKLDLLPNITIKAFESLFTTDKTLNKTNNLITFPITRKKIPALKNIQKLFQNKYYNRWYAQTQFMQKFILDYFSENNIEHSFLDTSTSDVNIEKIVNQPSSSQVDNFSNTINLVETEKNKRSVKSIKRKHKHSESESIKQAKQSSNASGGSCNEAVLLRRMYMGPNPTVIYQQTDGDNIETTVLLSSTPEEFKSMERCYPYLKENNLTQKTIERLNSIHQMVREQHVVIDVCNLKKLIVQEEVRKGYKGQADTKSISRIITRLAISGDVKIMLVNLKLFNKARHFFMVMEPSVSLDNSIIQSAIEKTKLRLFVESKKKQSESVKMVSKTVKKSITKTKKVIIPADKLYNTSIKNILPYKYNSHAGKTYGKQAKFAKMQILHEFLYYLIYEYSSENIMEGSTSSGVQEAPVVFKRDGGWKMFVPPLPKQVNWPDGWALISDIIVRMPVSLLLKLHNVPFLVPELKHILDHPIKQHYLVKHLGVNIRNVILYRRKYISNIFDVLTLLSYIGLIQFGPKQFCEKDQTMIYFNRKASLLNTVTSKPGYHLIEKKIYPKLEFEFTSSAIVKNYWFEMLNISMGTKLGVRNTVVGTYIIYEDVAKKTAMIEITKPQTIESVLVRDNGIIPGDGLGAAGLDSALWAHLRRNWAISQEKLRVCNQKYPNPKVKKVSKDKKTRKRRRIEVRKVLPRRDMKADKIKYDDVDRKLMMTLKTRRPPWTEEEERILYICKIVSLFLSPLHTKQNITRQVIRDVCHTLCPKSKNKTSQAFLRKSISIFGRCKKQKYLHEVAKNLCTSPFVKKFFQDLYNRIHNNREVFPINYLAGAFTYLVIHFFENQHEMQHIYDDIATFYNLKVKVDKTQQPLSHLRFDNVTINNTSVQVLKYNSIDLSKTTSKISNSPTLTYPKMESDIMVETIKSLIQVGIENLHEYETWRLKLHILYEGYPVDLLSRAETELRELRVISVPKASKLKSLSKKVMPAFSKFFQFSSYYLCTRAKQVKFPPILFSQAHEMFLEVISRKESFFNLKGNINLDNLKQSHLVGLTELASFIPVTVTLDIPKNVLILNSNVDDHMELIKELAVRYKKMLTELKEDITDCKKANLEEAGKIQYARRKPMLKRFIGSWFTTEDENEETTFEEDNDMEDINPRSESENTPQTPAISSSIPITFDTFEGFEQQLEVLLSSTSENSNLNETEEENIELTENENLDDFFNKKKFEASELDNMMVDGRGLLEFLAAKGSSNEEESSILYRAEPECEKQTVGNDKDKLDLITSNLKQLEINPNTVTDSRLDYLLSDNLTVDEIMREMIKEGPEKERKIPKATSLIRLLVADSNSNGDDEIERLSDHIVIKSPSIKFGLTDFSSPQFNYLENEHPKVCKKLLERIEADIVISNEVLSDEEIKSKFRSLGVIDYDINLISDLITFVSEKLTLGAPIRNLKKTYSHFRSIKLHEVLSILTKMNVFLRVGINYIIYVHTNYKEPWLIRSCRFDESSITKQTNDFSQARVFPWGCIDGSFNVEVFDTWILTIFGLCLNNVEGPLESIITECCSLKPVEVFYLIECLQELNCIRMVTYDRGPVSLTSPTTVLEYVSADVTVPFENIYLEVMDLAIIKFGTFINRDLKKFDFSNNLDSDDF